MQPDTSSDSGEDFKGVNFSNGYCLLGHTPIYAAASSSAGVPVGNDNDLVGWVRARDVRVGQYVATMPVDLTAAPRDRAPWNFPPSFY